MATQVYPDVLPQIPLRDGFSGRRRDERIFFPVERGQPKVRRGQHNRSYEQRVSYPMSDAQFGVFEDFYETDLRGGTRPFRYTDPRRHEDGIYMFGQGAYDYRDSGTLDNDLPVWIVSFMLVRIY